MGPVQSQIHTGFQIPWCTHLTLYPSWNETHPQNPNLPHPRTAFSRASIALASPAWRRSSDLCQEKPGLWYKIHRKHQKTCKNTKATTALLHPTNTNTLISLQSEWPLPAAVLWTNTLCSAISAMSLKLKNNFYFCIQVAVRSLAGMLQKDLAPGENWTVSLCRWYRPTHT